MFVFSAPLDMKKVYLLKSTSKTLGNPQCNENKDKLKTCLKIKSIVVSTYMKL